jgi:hypothetical protein
MGDVKRRRGRLPKPDTVESRESERRMEQIRSSAPTFAQQQLRNELASWLTSLDLAEKAILSDYSGYPNIPRDHIFEMASLGDEALSGHEEKVQKKGAACLQNADKFRRSGGDARKDIAAARDTELCQKNRVLLERVKPLGPLTTTSAAKKILAQWNHIPPESRAPGEEKLERRGVPEKGQDGGKIPNIRTIVRAIQRGSPFPQHRKRQTSWPKK